ncbi:MAG: FtsH protease activity modulator HflK [Verrucomicrobia bacterium]|nr:FtsH protease activity modulator HflK [Verrucomicrobiota bacterium]
MPVPERYANPVPPRFNAFRLARLLAGAVFAVIALWFLSSSYYTVPADSQGLVLRFGRYTTTSDPGLHFKFPFGVDQVLIAPVRRQLKQEFGFATSGATNPHQASDPREHEHERNMVTGDLNSASVEWVVQYRIAEPRQYFFKMKEPDFVLHDLSESVMRVVVGDRTVDEVITIGRQEIEAEALLKLRAVVEKFGLGIVIDQVQLKNVNPPQPVQSSFNEVNQSQQEREKAINIANGEYNRLIPAARGGAQEKISTAEGYAIKRVNEAEGDAGRFNAVFAEYAKAPDVMRRRLYLETMGEIVPNLGRKIILDDAAKQVLPLLQLTPEKEAK